MTETPKKRGNFADAVVGAVNSWLKKTRNETATASNTVAPHAPVSRYPQAWAGAPVLLEAQIKALEAAGLLLLPGRTIEELLQSWPRSSYEEDPYGLLLVMYGCEVEDEPWGRFFCGRGWNFDAECLESAGDYARAFSQILRITGTPHLATEMTDDFDIDAASCEIRYSIGGRERVLTARVDDDWVDPDATASFVRDVEAAIGDGRRFWAADNGQASVLFFLTESEATQINALRGDCLSLFAPP